MLGFRKRTANKVTTNEAVIDKSATALTPRQKFDICTKELLEILKELDDSSEVENLSKNVRSFVREEIRFFTLSIENYSWKISKATQMNSNF